MCFSAKASFGAAGILAILGYQTLKLVQERHQFPLAVVPFFFALQQFSEGVMWTFLSSDISPNALFYIAQFLYVFMAYLFYPIWFPFSVWTLEIVPWCRYVIFCVLLLGIGVAFLNIDLLSGVSGKKVIVKVIGLSLHYPEMSWSRATFYYLAVCLCCLLSSRKYVWCIGVTGSVALAVTYYFYYQTAASVWCFFAAFICMIIYLVIRDQRKIERTYQ